MPLPQISTATALELPGRQGFNVGANFALQGEIAAAPNIIIHHHSIILQKTGQSARSSRQNRLRDGQPRLLISSILLCSSLIKISIITLS
jgi:hypothetical protein